MQTLPKYTPAPIREPMRGMVRMTIVFGTTLAENWCQHLPVIPALKTGIMKAVPYFLQSLDELRRSAESSKGLA